MEDRVTDSISKCADAIDRLERDVADHFEKLEGSIVSPVALNELNFNEARVLKAFDTLRRDLVSSLVGFLPSEKPPPDQTCEEVTRRLEESTVQLENSLKTVAETALNEGKLLRMKRSAPGSAMEASRSRKR